MAWIHRWPRTGGRVGVGGGGRVGVGGGGRVGGGGGCQGTVEGGEHAARGWVGKVYDTAIALSSKKGWEALSPRDNGLKTW